MAGGSTKAVLYALAANAGIAVTKGGAAFYTGSGAMLAECIHSIADCANQLLLLLGIKQSAKPADAQHPLGYGRVGYFWSMLVAVMLFSVGGLYSIYEGIHRLQHPSEIEAPWVAVVVLLIGVLLEGLSMRGALREIAPLKRERTLWRWMRETRQSELLVVFGEDFAALAGLAFALAAVLVTLVTGNPVYDAIGTLVIGTLLVVVAVFLGNEIKAMITGESAEPQVAAKIEAALRECDEVAEIYNFFTLQWGAKVVVGVKARMREQRDAAKLLEDINRCEVAMRIVAPEIDRIFFEPDNRA